MKKFLLFALSILTVLGISAQEVEFQEDFSNPGNGGVPAGWISYDNGVNHVGPYTGGGGSRVNSGTGTKFNNGAYFRGSGDTGVPQNNAAFTYGQQSSNPLTLKAGKTRISFDYASWNTAAGADAPKFVVAIENASAPGATNITTLFSNEYPCPSTGTNGFPSDQTDEKCPSITWDVEIPADGNYVIRFWSNCGWGGYIFSNVKIVLLPSDMLAASKANFDEAYAALKTAAGTITDTKYDGSVKSGANSTLSTYENYTSTNPEDYENAATQMKNYTSAIGTHKSNCDNYVANVNAAKEVLDIIVNDPAHAKYMQLNSYATLNSLYNIYSARTLPSGISEDVDLESANTRLSNATKYMNNEMIVTVPLLTARSRALFDLAKSYGDAEYLNNKYKSIVYDLVDDDDELNEILKLEAALAIVNKINENPDNPLGCYDESGNVVKKVLLTPFIKNYTMYAKTEGLTANAAGTEADAAQGVTVGSICPGWTEGGSLGWPFAWHFHLADNTSGSFNSNLCRIVDPILKTWSANGTTISQQVSDLPNGSYTLLCSTSNQTNDASKVNDRPQYNYVEVDGQTIKQNWDETAGQWPGYYNGADGLNGKWFDAANYRGSVNFDLTGADEESANTVTIGTYSQSGGDNTFYSDFALQFVPQRGVTLDPTPYIDALGRIYHEHQFTFTLSDDGTTFTATCDNVDGYCSKADAGTITLAVPDNLEAIGDPITVQVNSNLSADANEAVGTIKVVYEYKSDASLEYEPATDLSQIGYYRASITINGQTASVEYEVVEFNYKEHEKNKHEEVAAVEIALVDELKKMFKDVMKRIETDYPDYVNYVASGYVEREINELEKEVMAAYYELQETYVYVPVAFDAEDYRADIRRLLYEADRRSKNDASYSADLAAIASLQTALNVAKAEVEDNYADYVDADAVASIQTLIDELSAQVEAEYVKVAEEGDYTPVEINSDIILDATKKLVADASIRAEEDATATGIAGVATGNKAAIHTLSGQKVNTLQKGINIVDGKKFLVK